MGSRCCYHLVHRWEDWGSGRYFLNHLSHHQWQIQGLEFFCCVLMCACICVHICVHFHVSTRVCRCACTCVHAYVKYKQRTTFGNVSHVILAQLSWDRLSHWPEAHWQDWTSWSVGPRNSPICLSISSARIASIWLFCIGSVVQTWVLCLHSKHFADCIIF